MSERRLHIAPLLAALFAAGCAFDPSATSTAPPVVLLYENPALVPTGDSDFLWNSLVDVVDDYFTIDREEPVRLIGDVVTEGRIETFPELGSTVFEPWRGDSATPYERLESTLQSIRRQAFVRVIPTGAGYLVDVAVFKELEDVARPDYAKAGSATFRHDTSLDRQQPPVGERMTTTGWIPLGRDAALEQQIIGQLLARVAPGRLPIGPPPTAAPPRF